MPDFGVLTQWIDTNTPPIVIYNTANFDLGDQSRWIDTNVPSLLIYQQTVSQTVTPSILDVILSVESPTITTATEGNFDSRFNKIQRQLEFSKFINGKLVFNKLVGEFYIDIEGDS